jgi:hypothetical protein
VVVGHFRRCSARRMDSAVGMDRSVPPASPHVRAECHFQIPSG